MKPFLKYIGSKSQIKENVLDHFPPNIESYYEPFVGGGSILLHFLEKLESESIKCTGHIYVNDINKDLIDCYLVIKNYVAEFVIELKNLPANTKDNYYIIRQLYNDLKMSSSLNHIDLIKKSTYFIYLNKLGFRGLYRESSKGNFNVPYGNYTNPTIASQQNLLDISHSLNKYNVQFYNLSYIAFFDLIKKNITHNSLVFVDSPYYPLKKDTFVSFTKEGFSLNDHTLLRNILHNINAKIISTNHDVSFINENYSTWSTETIEVKRRINAKNPTMTTNEVILKNF